MFSVMRESEDRLKKEVWIFGVMQQHPGGRIKVVLNSYTVSERESKRHGYTLIGYYQRTDQRQNTLATEMVPLPTTVTDEALRVAIGMIDVVMDLD